MPKCCALVRQSLSIFLFFVTSLSKTLSPQANMRAQSTVQEESEEWRFLCLFLCLSRPPISLSDSASASVSDSVCTVH